MRRKSQCHWHIFSCSIINIYKSCTLCSCLKSRSSWCAWCSLCICIWKLTWNRLICFVTPLSTFSVFSRQIESSIPITSFKCVFPFIIILFCIILSFNICKMLKINIIWLFLFICYICWLDKFRSCSKYWTAFYWIWTLWYNFTDNIMINII